MTTCSSPFTPGRMSRNPRSILSAGFTAYLPANKVIDRCGTCHGSHNVGLPHQNGVRKHPRPVQVLDIVKTTRERFSNYRPPHECLTREIVDSNIRCLSTGLTAQTTQRYWCLHTNPGQILFLFEGVLNVFVRWPHSAYSQLTGNPHA